jgi:NADPH2:quinone reductase
MRVLEIFQLTGPRSAFRVAERPEPDPDATAVTGEPGVVVEVHAAGVAFPEVLQSYGRYQLQPEPPFVPGSEVAGTVRSAPPGSDLRPGDRVAAFCGLGGFAETAVAPAHLTFRLPDALDDAQGAGLIMNYHTAWFALALRGRLRPGETVLVHGAAGGVGTAALQVAKGLGATAIAVVSSEAKAQVARAAGADHVVRADGPWKDQVRELTGDGVDVVCDPVGGDRFTDSLRALREGGRLVVVGFTGGAIPEVRVNRLLLNNLEVIGAGWGAYVLSKPDVNRRAGAALEAMVAAGHVAPVVGARVAFDDVVRGLELIEGRGATGKVVLDVRPPAR